MAGYMHGDLLHQILCFMEEPSAVSLKRMHVTLSLVSNAWHAGVKRLKSDEYRKTPLVERAEVFRLTVPALHLAYDVDALLLGLRTYQSCFECQEDIVLALAEMLRFQEQGVDISQEDAEQHMRRRGVFGIVVSTMRLSVVSGDTKNANLLTACVSLLHELIVHASLPFMANFAGVAGVFETVASVMHAKMQCGPSIKGYAFSASFRGSRMQEEGMRLLYEGLCVVCPEGCYRLSTRDSCDGSCKQEVYRFAPNPTVPEHLKTAVIVVVVASIRVDLRRYAMQTHTTIGLRVLREYFMQPRIGECTANTVEMALGALRYVADITFLDTKQPDGREYLLSVTEKMRFSACELLCQLAGTRDVDTAQSIVAMDGIALLLALLRDTESPNMTETCCLALGFLGWSDATLQQRIVAEDGVPALQGAVSSMSTGVCKEHALCLLHKLLRY